MNNREIIKRYIKKQGTPITKTMYYLGCYKCWVDGFVNYEKYTEYDIKYKIRLWNPLSWIIILIWIISSIVMVLIEENLLGEILSIPKTMKSTFAIKNEEINSL